MDSSTHNEPVAQKQIAPEFGSWPMGAAQMQHVNEVRGLFDELQARIGNYTSPQNGRYLSLVKTKLEEACLFAVKGIAKP